MLRRVLEALEIEIAQIQGGSEMLVLSRKKGQRTIIAESIRLVVLSVQGDRVKLGFEGPPDVPILREEVFERIACEAADATQDPVVPAL